MTVVAKFDGFTFDSNDWDIDYKTQIATVSISSHSSTITLKVDLEHCDYEICVNNTNDPQNDVESTVHGLKVNEQNIARIVHFDEGIHAVVGQPILFEFDKELNQILEEDAVGE